MHRAKNRRTRGDCVARWGADSGQRAPHRCANGASVTLGRVLTTRPVRTEQPLSPPGTVPHARLRKAAQAGYWNVTGNDSVLLVRFFSPGTFSIVAITVWVPVGGVELSVTLQVAWCPAIVSGTVVEPVSLVP
jgi:hypothetical protein